MPSRTKRPLLLGLPVLVAAFFYWVPALPQDPAYHQFADQRSLFGIPHFWNFTSNLPFILVGLLGMRRVWHGDLPGGLPELRANYLMFFVGVLLIGCGSGYYHLVPSNRTLVWDRLPMALSFMAFFTALLGEQGSPRLGRRLLAPLVLVGGLSVLYWYGTELAGHGDLRPYVLVQFLPMLFALVLLLSVLSPLTGSGFIWAVLGAYTGAKFLEWQDAVVLQVLGEISGHTLKHVSAAAAACIFLLALDRRQRRELPAMHNRDRVGS